MKEQVEALLRLTKRVEWILDDLAVLAVDAAQIEEENLKICAVGQIGHLRNVLDEMRESLMQ